MSLWMSIISLGILIAQQGCSFPSRGKSVIKVTHEPHPPVGYKEPLKNRLKTRYVGFQPRTPAPAPLSVVLKRPFVGRGRNLDSSQPMPFRTGGNFSARRVKENARNNAQIYLTLQGDLEDSASNPVESVLERSVSPEMTSASDPTSISSFVRGTDTSNSIKNKATGNCSDGGNTTSNPNHKVTFIDLQREASIPEASSNNKSNVYIDLQTESPKQIQERSLTTPPPPSQSRGREPPVYINLEGDDYESEGESLRSILNLTDGNANISGLTTGNVPSPSSITSVPESEVRLRSTTENPSSDTLTTVNPASTTLQPTTIATTTVVAPTLLLTTVEVTPTPIFTTSTTTEEDLPVVVYKDDPKWAGNPDAYFLDDYEVYKRRGCIDFSCKDL